MPGNILYSITPQPQRSGGGRRVQRLKLIKGSIWIPLASQESKGNITLSLK